MKLAIIFWFYKEADVCINRLELIKQHNPKIKIYGLYGGNLKDASFYQKKLGKYLDNFFVSTLCNKRRDWKWINGDLMILDWYQNRGKNLSNWDSVLVVQWDALVLGDIKKQFPGIKKDEVFISGTRILDNNVESKWHWTKPGSKRRNNFLRFKKYVEKKYDYKNKLWCSLFILQVFPKSFFKKWNLIENKELGMLEYKIPTYAKILNFSFYKRNLGIWWFSKKVEKLPLNARPKEIGKEFIDKELKKKNGYRIFHPYFKIWQ